MGGEHVQKNNSLRPVRRNKAEAARGWIWCHHFYMCASQDSQRVKLEKQTLTLMQQITIKKHTERRVQGGAEGRDAFKKRETACHLHWPHPPRGGYLPSARNPSQHLYGFTKAHLCMLEGQPDVFSASSSCGF